MCIRREDHYLSITESLIALLSAVLHCTSRLTTSCVCVEGLCTTLTQECPRSTCLKTSNRFCPRLMSFSLLPSRLYIIHAFSDNGLFPSCVRRPINVMNTEQNSAVLLSCVAIAVRQKCVVLTVFVS